MRSLLASLLVVAALLLCVCARAQTGLSNMDFEQGAVGQPPPGWFVPQPVLDGGYVVLTSSDSPKEGKKCASIELTGSQPSGFGNMMQSVDAAPYRGKRIKFRAAVRFEAGSVQGHAQLWLRVDRPNGQMGFFNNMGDRPISSGQWAFYEISGTVDADAQSVNFGMLMVGGGRAYIDAASLRTADAKPATAVKARALSDRGLVNLIAFTKLYGYVRHFHPSDAVEKADWNAYARAGVVATEDASSPQDLADRLQKFFLPLAPTVQVFVTGTNPPLAVNKPAASTNLQVVTWDNLGFGGGVRQGPEDLYQSHRVFSSTSTADPRKPFEADLGGGVHCRVPMALYAVSGSALPTTVAPTLADDPEDESGDDRTTRLADVLITWNVYEHFFPYFDVVKTDWPAVLSSSLNEAALDPDGRAFLSTLRKLVASAHDGHGNVVSADDHDYAMPGIAAEWVEGKLVVTAVAPDITALRAGMVIEAIDGTPVDEAWKTIEQLSPGATEQWRRYRAVIDMLRGPDGSSIELQIKSEGGAPSKVTLNRKVGAAAVEKRPEAIEEIKPGIWYVDLDSSRAKMVDYKAALHSLTSAQGIVFDMRGYPNEVAMDAIQRITDKAITSAIWNIPKVDKPDHAFTSYNVSRWPLMGPLVPKFRGKIAFITDGRAISYAESIMGIVEFYKLGAIVGGPTAGTNGDINPVALPGRYTFIFTGMKVLKHDGTAHHGVGIQPTAPVHRTIAGVAAHKDELLEKAISVVSGG